MKRVRLFRYRCCLNEGHDEGQLEVLFNRLKENGYLIRPSDGSSSAYSIENTKSGKEVGHLTIGPNLLVLLDIYGSSKLKKIAKNFEPYSVFG